MACSVSIESGRISRSAATSPFTSEHAPDHASHKRTMRIGASIQWLAWEAILPRLPPSPAEAPERLWSKTRLADNSFSVSLTP